MNWNEKIDKKKDFFRKKVKYFFREKLLKKNGNKEFFSLLEEIGEAKKFFKKIV